MTGEVHAAERSAHQAARSTPVKVGARIGIAAYGLTHLLVAWLALQLGWRAWGPRPTHGRAADSSGALAVLAQSPLGTPLLSVLAVGLGGLALWQAVEVARHHRRLPPPGGERRRALAQADVRLEQLRLHWRQCVTLDLIAPNRYEHGARLIDEVGRLLEHRSRVVGVCRMVLTACSSWARQIDGMAMRQDTVNGAAPRRSWAASTVDHSPCIHYPIMQQTGHKSERMVRRYIRDGELFRENAAAIVGL
jgi:hypothetical protein